jgi:hypothetical protein
MISYFVCQVLMISSGSGQNLVKYFLSFFVSVFSQGSQEHILEFFDDQFFVSVNFALCPDMKPDSAFFDLNLI